MRTRSWTLGFACLAACAGAPWTSYTPSTPTAEVGPPRAAEQVELLTEMPARPHVQIGIVGGAWERTAPEPVYVAMQREAARHRCDALVITGTIPPPDSGPGYVKRYSGACLVYTDDFQSPKPAAVPSCEPVCSPGYHCEAGTCVAECNPICSPGYTCADDRTCKAVELEVAVQ